MIEHRCCYFHFHKAIFDNAKKNKLDEKNKTVPAFNAYLRMFPALALIPANYIDAAFAYLKSRALEFTGGVPTKDYAGLQDFLQYFQKVK